MRQPTAILISSNPGVLASLEEQLTRANFAVFAAASALDGYDYAIHMLGITLSARTTAILIDTSDVHSVLVAAGLAQRMQQRVIPLVWLIALLDKQDPARELEARLSGCQQMLQLPLVEDAVTEIQHLLKRPASLPHSEIEPHTAQVINTLQTIADRMLQAALEVQPERWTARDVTGLLYQLTSYPQAPETETTRVEQWTNMVEMNLRTEQIIRILGGIRAAREFLEYCVHYLQPRYPLHSQVLEKFLAGWQRKEIVRYFVDQRLYEDSRIYASIRELPQRISDILKIQGE